MDDDDLRDLFMSESAEQLSRLGTILLAIERVPAARAELDEAFRIAHNVKGNARLLGFATVETLAHALEDVLGAARKGRMEISSEHIDLLCGAVDALRSLCAAATAGDPSAETTSLAARLRAVLSGSPVRARDERVGTQSSDDVASPAPLHRGGDSTVRVKTAQLDALLESTGELFAARTRLDDLPRVLGDLSERLNALRRDAAWRVAFGERASGGRSPEDRLDEMVEELERLGRATSAEIAALSAIAETVDGIVRGTRLVPVASLFDVLPRAARDVAREQEKDVSVEITGGEAGIDRRLVEGLRDPLLHLVRNGVDHGLEGAREREEAGKPRIGRLTIDARIERGRLKIRVADDGRGIDPEAVREAAVRAGAMSPADASGLGDDEAIDLVFLPALTTRTMATTVSGRGVGLDIVRSAARTLGGSVSVSSIRGSGATFVICVPLVVATRRLLVVEAAGQMFAIPDDALRDLDSLPESAIARVEGRDVAVVRDRAVILARLGELLPIPAAARTARRAYTARERDDGSMLVVVLAHEKDEVGIVVDAFDRFAESIVEPLGLAAGNVPLVAGTAQLGSSGLAVVLNPSEVVRAALGARPAMLAPVEEQSETPRRAATTVLLADDSIVSRSQQRRILQTAGYEVIVAVDGLDALDKLATHDVDCLVTDVEMPRLDGFELARRVRSGRRRADLPIVIVTSLSSDAERRRGVEVGADAYITKGDYDEKVLLDAIRRLV